MIVDAHPAPQVVNTFLLDPAARALCSTFVSSVAPAAEVGRLGRIVEGNPAQLGPLIPAALAVGTRKKRMAITSEDPPAKALQPVATALRQVAGFVQEYTA